MKVLDLEGNELGTYADSVQNGVSLLGLGFACYSTGSPDHFTFLGTSEDYRLVVKIAEPQ